jgi:hypothetical protein
MSNQYTGQQPMGQPPRQQPHPPNMPPHGRNPRNHTAEGVNVQPFMTTEDIRRQIEQSVDAQMMEVDRNVAKMKSTGAMTSDFAERQRAAQMATAAAMKSVEKEDILKAASFDKFKQTNENTNALDDTSFVKHVEKKASFDSEFGMKDDNKLNKNKKTLSSEPRGEKPASKTLKDTTQPASTFTTNAPVVDAPVVDAPVVDAETHKTQPSIDKIDVFFVPNALIDKSKNDVLFSSIVSSGKENQIVSTKFRPVVYLKEEDAANYERVDISGIKVKDGYVQVDALDFAKKNGVNLHDVAESKNRLDILGYAMKSSTPECQIAVQPFEKGQPINDFAISEVKTNINVPVVVDGTKAYNAFECELVTRATRHEISVDKVLKNAYASSKDEDERVFSELYSDKNYQTELYNQSIESDMMRLFTKEGREEISQDFAELQKRHYTDKGLSSEKIAHLEKLGYIGFDSFVFKEHISGARDFVNNFGDLSQKSHQIVDGAGKFAVIGNSPNTDFGGFLMQHKEDIIDSIGSKIGFSSEESRKQKIHISTPSVLSTQSTTIACAITYEGFIGKDSKEIDDAIRESIQEVLDQYGDKHVELGKTYAVEQFELDMCNNPVDVNRKPEYVVLPYGVEPPAKPKSEPKEPETPTLNDDALMDYYVQMADDGGYSF